MRLEDETHSEPLRTHLTSLQRFAAEHRPTATARKLNPVVAQHKTAQRTHISYVKCKYDKKAVWQQ